MRSRDQKKLTRARRFLISKSSFVRNFTIVKMPRPSPTPSSSSRSSVTPPPQVSEKKKKKTSAKAKTSEVQADHGKNEGVDPNWDYAPPPGAVLVEKEEVDGGEFDWDKINNDEDLELWLIRVPEGVSFLWSRSFALRVFGI